MLYKISLFLLKGKQGLQIEAVFLNGQRGQVPREHCEGRHMSGENILELQHPHY